MKRVLLFFILCPVIIWAQNPERLQVLLDSMYVGPCEAPWPGSPPQYRGRQQIGPNYVPAGSLVVLEIRSCGMGWNDAPCTLPYSVRVGLTDPDLAIFFCGNINENHTWDTLELNTEGYAGDSIRPIRATVWQKGALPEDITEFRFVVEDITGSLLPDTSSPLDSVVPNSFDTLLLVLPGEQHFPGDKDSIGKREIQIPQELYTDRFYDFWVYGTDAYYNTVFGCPDLVWLTDSSCPTVLAPDSVFPETALLCTEVPVPDTTPDTVGKKLYQVRYSYIGKARLKAIGINTAITSLCECFNVISELPPRIRIIPNPGGTPGCPVKIEIVAVPTGVELVRAKIFDNFGYLVKDFSEELQKQARDNPSAPYWELKWDLKNEKGHRVNNGCYHFCLEITQAEKGGIWREKIGVVW